MSRISPRRTISRASRARRRWTSMSSSSSAAASARSLRPESGRRTSPRRSSPASDTSRPAGRRVGHQADFLVALAPRRLLRRFPLVDAARPAAPTASVHRVAVLADQDHFPGLGHRHEHDRLRMPDDVDGDLAAVRHPHAIAIDVKTLPSKTRSVERRSASGSVVRHPPSESRSVLGVRPLLLLCDLVEHRFRSGGSGDSNSSRRPSVGCVNASRAECRNGRSSRCTARRLCRDAPVHAAVGRVADDRMADRAEVNADLVRAAGGDRDLEQRHALEVPREGDARHRAARPARARRHLLPVARIAPDRRVDAPPGLHHAPHERDVFLLDLAVAGTAATAPGARGRSSRPPSRPTCRDRAGARCPGAARRRRRSGPRRGAAARSRACRSLARRRDARPCPPACRSRRGRRLRRRCAAAAPPARGVAGRGAGTSTR